MKKLRISYLKELVFFLIAPLFILTKIYKSENLKRKYIAKGLNIFKFDKLNCLSQKLDNKSEIVILGCGASVDELTKQDFNHLENRITIGLARWFYQDFVPDILIVEFSRLDKDFKDTRWLDHFIEEINKRSMEYSKTLILIEAVDSLFELHYDILNRISPILRTNISFIISFTSYNFKNFPKYFISFPIYLRILQSLNILWHSRTIAFYGASIAFYLKAKNLLLIGLDGYEGYFKSFSSYKNDLILNKNFKNKMHSCSNPEFGVPTMTDSFVQISKFINVNVVSKNTIISKYVPVVQIK